MRRNYKKKPKQQQIDNLLNIYAAIGQAAKAQPEQAPKKSNDKGESK